MLVQEWQDSVLVAEYDDGTEAAPIEQTADDIKAAIVGAVEAAPNTVAGLKAAILEALA